MLTFKHIATKIISSPLATNVAAFAAAEMVGKISRLATVLAMAEGLRSFAGTLRELGRCGDAIRSEVLELVRANRGAMRDRDVEFLERRVRAAIDEMLGESG